MAASDPAPARIEWTMQRTILILAALLAALLTSSASPGASGAPQDLWRVAGRPAERAILLPPTGDFGDVLGEAQSPMLARLGGAIGVIQGDQARRLARTAGRGARSTDPQIRDASIALIVRLFARDKFKDVEILHTPDGRAAARELGQTSVVWLDRSAFEGLIAASGHYRGPIDRPAHEQSEQSPGGVFELDQPYTSGWFKLTSQLLSERMFPGMRVRIRGAALDLRQETLVCRLPRNYDPKNPAGLLVWIDPTDLGDPPRQLHAAADEFNLILVGARDAPNNRLVVERMQLAMDGIATACERFHVDESRIYVTGMSGGGRTSSMLWSAFPDVFAGAIPIVGLNHYREITVKGEEMAAGFGRVKGWQLRQLKARRLAPMTGPIDFNYDEMTIRARHLEQDGFDVRLFEYPDMGHTMPTPPRFYDAMGWVDEPWQIARDESISSAQEQLDLYKDRFAEGPLSRTPRARETLIEITRIAPWSAPAWEAVELLASLQTDG